VGGYRSLNGPVIWLHAVSVGETRACAPLLHALLDAHPDHRVLLTHMTPTGRATAAELFGELAPRVQSAYLPYDTRGRSRASCATFTRASAS
jgi:3-deoxy-D-manno-octulosonic-acid transferase